MATKCEYIDNDRDIMTSDNLKLLGATIDCSLNLSVLINSVCKKASQRIGVIMRLRNLIPTEAKLHLYKAAILPHLTYCHLVKHFCRASDTHRSERVQEGGLRAVLKTSCSANSSRKRKPSYQHCITGDYQTNPF